MSTYSIYSLRDVITVTHPDQTDFEVYQDNIKYTCSIFVVGYA